METDTQFPTKGVGVEWGPPHCGPSGGSGGVRLDLTVIGFP